MRKINKEKFHGGYEDKEFYSDNMKNSDNKLPNQRLQASITSLSSKYTFNLHMHPFAHKLAKRLREASFEGLLAYSTELKTDNDTPSNTNVKEREITNEDYALFEDFFNLKYAPTSSFVNQPYPVKDLNFLPEGAYSVYYWELFFHIPFNIAIQLSKNQRYEEAQKWFHFIFNPTDDSSEQTPQKFWKVKPLKISAQKSLEQLLRGLSEGTETSVKDSIEAWEENPFRPHVIARFRPSAYQYKTVMAYLDNLIAWGDSLFRQDSIESLNEATQIYILAANLLGRKPELIPIKRVIKPVSYQDLRKNLDDLSNAMVTWETVFPFDRILGLGKGMRPPQRQIVQNIWRTLYFCVPSNEKMLSYWEITSDRLFKIRNSLNMQGIFRQLPLFEPPIDPALLARATAAGVDIDDVINGINQPLPIVRFSVLVQKAAEICQEVKTLGNNLLSTIEKEDNEALSVIRARHEKAILGITEVIKYGQWQESIKTKQGIEKSFVNAVERYVYYERLLGKKQKEIVIPNIEEIDLEDLNKFRFETQEPSVEVRDINIDITNSGKGWGGNLHLSPILPGEENITGGKKLNSQERDELINLENAQFQKESASLLLMAAEALSHFPDLNLQLSFWGIGSWLHLGKISDALEFSSKIFNSLSDRSSYDAVRSGKMAGYTRREQEWAYQSNLAVGEINQTYKQIRAAQIREALSEREWKNHQQQMKNAEEIERFLTDEKEGKMTNQAFYSWMRREIKGLYSQCFQFAFDLAKKAERAMQYELGDTGLNYIKYGYLSGKEGLLAGDKLFMDIKFMEAAYLEKNQREFELTKHISLVLLNPMSLLDLRTKGECYIEIPEVLFDLDHSGHYMRRIKSVSLSIPCIAGPYTNVSAKLTLHSNRLRRKNNLNEEELSPSYFGIQSIATSHAQNDSGLFELNFRDERYLPFEGAGAISSWRLELPTEFSQFDYNTISDVVMHMNYTARDGGEAFKDQVNAQIKTSINNWLTAMENSKQPLALLLSLKDNFPMEWHVLQTDQKADLILDIKHFPFMMQGWKLKTEQISIYRAGETAPVELDKTENGILVNLKPVIQENEPATVPISWQSEPLPKNLYVLIHYILTDKKVPPTK